MMIDARIIIILHVHKPLYLGGETRTAQRIVQAAQFLRVSWLYLSDRVIETTNQPPRT